MNKMVYLDNSATTKPCNEAIDAVNKSLSENWGNPSSLHILGMKAEEDVFSARLAIAKLIKCREDEIYFTSGGTESNNTAIFGAAKARMKRGKRIVTSAIEHPSILEAVNQLENEGFEIIRIKPELNGNIDPEKIYSAVNENTILVSLMLVNNETGAILPISAAADAIKKSGAPALLHCDAVQGFGKLPIDVTKSGIDLLTASGHKIHGPKGIGFIYMKKGTTIRPFLFGGGQEKGMRSGTEAVPMICGFGGAVTALPDIYSQLKATKELCDYARLRLTRDVGAIINSPENALPYVLNISVEGYRSETLLHFLESYNIFVSSGSACSKGKGSYVLNEMELSRKRVDSALRLSFSRFNTKEDIDALCEALKCAKERLRKAN